MAGAEKEEVSAAIDVTGAAAGRALGSYLRVSGAEFTYCLLLIKPLLFIV